MWWRYASTASLVSLDRKSTRLNSSHTEIYTLSLHDALPIFIAKGRYVVVNIPGEQIEAVENNVVALRLNGVVGKPRSEEHTSELQSHRDLHSFPTRRSSDLHRQGPLCGGEYSRRADRSGGKQCGGATPQRRRW